MNNPTRDDLDKAWHLEGATPAIIAQALADARASKVTHYYENPTTRETVALCFEPRWYTLTDMPDCVTCKRCLHFMKTPIAEIRAHRKEAAEARGRKG